MTARELAEQKLTLVRKVRTTAENVRAEAEAKIARLDIEERKLREELDNLDFVSNHSR